MRRHNRPKKYTHPRILILCEGETEEKYFKGIIQDETYKVNLSGVRVTIFTGKNAGPLKLVKEAITRRTEGKKEGNPYKEVWVIFDHDIHPNRKAAWDKAQKNGLKIGFSAIAFEQWFLLHFSKSSKAFETPKQLEKELVKFYSAYKKAQSNHFAFLKNRLSVAFTNAEWLRNIKTAENRSITDQNPWIDVDILVAKMISGNF